MTTRPEQLPAEPSPPDVPATTSTATARFDRRLMAPMILGSILNPINSSIIAVALVPIAIALGAPASQTAWLVSALYLATSIGQPLVGRLVDTYGPRPLYLVGAALTGVAGLLGLFAPSLGVLIAARVILGFGTCAGYPASMHLIRSEGRRTGVDRPAAVLSALSIAHPDDHRDRPDARRPADRSRWLAGDVRHQSAAVDRLPGARLARPAEAHRAAAGAERTSPPRPGRLPALRRDARDTAGLPDESAAPPARQLAVGGRGRDRLRAVGAATQRAVHRRPRLCGQCAAAAHVRPAVVAATVSYSFIYGFTQWLESGRGLSPSAAGLILLPAFALGIAVVALPARKPQIRAKLIVGAIGQLVASALLLLVHPDAAVWFLLVIVIILGIPQGLVNLAIQNTALLPGRRITDRRVLGAAAHVHVPGRDAGRRRDRTILRDERRHRRAARPGLVHGRLGRVFLLITLLDRSLGRVDRAAASARPRSDGASGLTGGQDLRPQRGGVVSAAAVPGQPLIQLLTLLMRHQADHVAGAGLADEPRTALQLAAELRHVVGAGVGQALTDQLRDPFGRTSA